MPLATINAVAPQRTTLEASVARVNTALTNFESTYYSGATPILPTPAELTRLITEGANILTDITALSAGHTHTSIAALDSRVIKFRDDIDNAQSLFVGHEAEWKTDIMTPAEEVEKRSSEFISEASGSWIRRKTRNGLEKTLVLNAHNRQETKKFLKRHKGKIASGLGAGAILYGVLHMDGCSTSSGHQMPPTGTTTAKVGEKFHPLNKRTSDGGAEYNGEGKSFSVGGFLNASKVTFANGSSPEAQAFQGVWNYIDEHRPDEKWGPGEEFHFHTTPDLKLENQTHYDVNAYTAGNDTKVIEITWQKQNGKEINGKSLEKLNNHTWRFTMNSNGTISKTNVFHDGREEANMGIITKVDFQRDLGKIQGF